MQSWIFFQDVGKWLEVVFVYEKVGCIARGLYDDLMFVDKIGKCSNDIFIAKYVYLYIKTYL